MKITNVQATTHNIDVDNIPFVEEVIYRGIVFVKVETDTGLTGYGITSKAQWFGVRELINREMAPILEDMSPLETEKIWYHLRVKLNKRVQTGAWSSAMSAVDIALWDLKGKYYDEPIWRLLGGAQYKLPAYITMGLRRYNEDQLVDVAKNFISDGQNAVKIKAGIDICKTSQDIITKGNPSKDASRVAAIRQNVGDDVDIMIDANYELSINHAKELCSKIEQYNITWFEEPVSGNDAILLKKLGENTDIPIAAGQDEGHRYRHRELIASGAIDIAQPNVLYVGGYTEGKKVASLAQTYNIDLANGAGFPNHNMHLQASSPNGWYVEFHLVTWNVERRIYKGTSDPVNGIVTLSEKPGLGLQPNWDVLEETQIE